MTMPDPLVFDKNSLAVVWFHPIWKEAVIHDPGAMEAATGVLLAVFVIGASLRVAVLAGLARNHGNAFDHTLNPAIATCGAG